MNGSSSAYILESGATITASVLVESPSDDNTASVIGLVADSYGTAYGGVPVTLHITNSAGTELGTMQTTTSGSQPYVGVYEFSHVALPDGALYGYVTSSAQISDTYIANGASKSFYLDPYGTATANIVLQVPYYSTDVFSWSGMITDSQNYGYGGIPITIHVMNESHGEIYNTTTTSSSSQPFVGFFVYDHLSLPQYADYAYVNSTAQLTDDIVVNGESRGIYLKKERTVAGTLY
jgi:hypothetical protein